MRLVAAQIERAEKVRALFQVAGMPALVPVGENPEFLVGPVGRGIFGLGGLGLVFVEQEREQVGEALAGHGLGPAGMTPAAKQEKVVGRFGVRTVVG